jgi:hypothetical protein
MSPENASTPGCPLLAVPAHLQQHQRPKRTAEPNLLEYKRNYTCPIFENNIHHHPRQISF